MKKSPPGPGVFAETWAETCALLREWCRLVRRHVFWAAGAVLLCGLITVLFFPHDRAWLTVVQFFRGDAEKSAHAWAWQLGRWGDYPTYNLPAAILLWIFAALTRSRLWLRVAVVCFLGAAFAGLFDDFFRLTMGRPRPDIYPTVADGFYGPAKAIFGKYESFPSGHAASDIGMGVALLFVSRTLGLITTAYALLVVWGRMELNKHYPSDVAVGSIIGLYFGVMVGLAGRREPSNKS